MSRNVAHMRETAIATLEKNMASSPSLMAGALQDLFDLCAALHGENSRYEKEFARLKAETAKEPTISRERDHPSIGGIKTTS
jgi:hypothetical protein